MSTIMIGFQQDWNCDGLPGSSITLGQGGVLFVNDRVIDTNTGKRYKCTAVGTFDDIDTYTGCAFVLDIDDSNLLPTIANNGWETNTARNYAASEISLNSSRRPSTTNDTFVAATINLVNTLLTTTTVVAEVSPDNSTWTTVGQIADTTGVADNTTQMIGFIVPANYYYRLTSSGSGTITLTSCQELSF